MLAGSLLGHHPALDDIRLMVTELIANAIRHTRSGRPSGTLTVTITDLGQATRVEVMDQGCATSHPHRRDDTNQDSEDGYGLQLVATLAKEWGSGTDEKGSKTWFEI